MQSGREGIHAGVVRQLLGRICSVLHALFASLFIWKHFSHVCSFSYSRSPWHFSTILGFTQRWHWVSGPRHSSPLNREHPFRQRLFSGHLNRTSNESETCLWTARLSESCQNENETQETIGSFVYFFLEVTDIVYITAKTGDCLKTDGRRHTAMVQGLLISG